MIEVHATPEFRKWFNRLRDIRARARIQLRIDRLVLGLFGDVKYFGGIGELRVDYGPGYRIYFVHRSGSVVVLLCGGDEGSQDRDIARALKLALDQTKE